MILTAAFFLVILAAILFIAFAGAYWKGIITVIAVSILAILSSIPAIQSLRGVTTEYIFPGSLVTGYIPVRIDALSGWFILIINFTFLTGVLYGMHYLKSYNAQSAHLSLHYIAYIIVHASLLCICSLQNSLAFLVAWEMMALSSFILIIFEHSKHETMKAGINFLIQSHVCIMFLTLGFIWVSMKMNSYDFTAITSFSTSNIFQPSIATGTTLPSSITGIVLFLCFFMGFAIKAGFVPFHTWLPYAHPAAPAHVSGVMSGVIIKIGIYGILRMLLLIKSDYTILGYIILIISVVSGVYGVMLAILQHNLKKLLAYHSIENIGIIGIGIGLGCIGIGTGNKMLTILGMGGALLHTLNHSLFKSLLFYGAGNVYQSTHTMNIEQLGGISKRMPHTALLFLLAALAICGLPPFNGFISEFLIYNGMFAGYNNANLVFLSVLAFSIFGFVLIGGLAILCFTKAFGSVFLGTSQSISLPHDLKEAGIGKLLPMYAILFLMLGIGIFPNFFIVAISKSVNLFSDNIIFNNYPNEFPVSSVFTMVSYCALGFIVLTSFVFYIRKKITGLHSQSIATTWGCGYVAPNYKMQYTASSFVRAYRKLAEPVLSIHKKKKTITAIFPKDGLQQTHAYDKAEEWFIDYPLRQLKHFFNRFAFLQNGNPQFYILYGVAFIILVLGVPLFYVVAKSIIQFMHQL